MFDKAQKIHFVGIGGIGMSAIALYFSNKGFVISGSDGQESDITRKLMKCGINVFIGHNSKYVENCDILIYSSAIQSNNVELQKANDRNIKIFSRAEALNLIAKQSSTCIAVGGTHGKTTTTSMLGCIFSEANLKPVVLAGGIMKNFNSNYIDGNDEIIILEADEYDHSFLTLHPDYAIITSIDADHLDCYGSLENLKQNFVKFSDNISENGKLIICNDDPNILDIKPELNIDIHTFSVIGNADIIAKNIIFKNNKSEFRVNYKNKEMGSVQLNAAGIHNVKNALASIIIALDFGIPFHVINSALHNFQGVERRFDILEQNDDYILVDDYAHHPTEIFTTLDGAKKAWSNRILAIFQPHLYSRTKNLYKEFAKALELADEVIITNVYAAREKVIPFITGKLIFDEMKKNGFCDVYYVEEFDSIITEVSKLKQPGDMIITLGAGDINKIHKELKKL